MQKKIIVTIQIQAYNKLVDTINVSICLCQMLNESEYFEHINSCFKYVFDKPILFKIISIKTL